MNVLIILEDFTYDQHILKPLVQAMFRALGKARARVAVCFEPQLGGVEQALDATQIMEIVDQYPMVDLFLLCVDRDGKPGRWAALDKIEAAAQDTLRTDAALFGENAWQEIEVWALAGHDLPPEWSWRAIREEVAVKERYFFPLAQRNGLPDDALLVYKTMGQAAARRYPRVRQLCSEDVGNLRNRIENWLNQPAHLP